MSLNFNLKIHKVEITYCHIHIHDTAVIESDSSIRTETFHSKMYNILRLLYINVQITVHYKSNSNSGKMKLPCLLLSSGNWPV